MMSGCSMIVYDARLSRAVVALTSRLQLQLHQQQYHYQPHRLLLTSGPELIVCVDCDRIVIWRLSTGARLTPSNKYTSDNAPADDEDCDIDSYLYDDTTGYTQQSADNATQMIQQQKDLKCRYILKIDTSVDCVALTSDMFLVVGNRRGHVLVFNIRLIAYDGGHSESHKHPAPFVTVLPEVRHYGEITTVCLSSKLHERYVVCGSIDSSLSVFDRQLNHRQSLLVGHEDKILCASISPCDKFVASGSSDCSIRLWRLTTGCQLAIFDACIDVYSVVVYRQDDHDDQLRLAALADRQSARKLMLFRTYNIDTTNATPQF